MKKDSYILTYFGIFTLTAFGVVPYTYIYNTFIHAHLLASALELTFVPEEEKKKKKMCIFYTQHHTNSHSGIFMPMSLETEKQ